MGRKCSYKDHNWVKPRRSKHPIIQELEVLENVVFMVFKPEFLHNEVFGPSAINRCPYPCCLGGRATALLRAASRLPMQHPKLKRNPA